jgi:sugar lactone lactonase YvrE
MGFEIGDVVGRVYSLEAGASEGDADAEDDGPLEASPSTIAGGKTLTLATVMDDVTCTNGMGWTRDGKIM